MPDLTCLDHNEDCKGEVQFRMSLSSTGRSFPRCDYHWDKRLEAQEEFIRKDAEYRKVDYLDAGERYEEDE